MNTVTKKTRLGSLRLYKFDVPSESNVVVILISHEAYLSGFRMQLTRCRGRGRNSKAGMSKSFVELITWFFLFDRKDCYINNQIFAYIASNLCFKDFEIVPPAYARTRFVPIAPPTTEIIDCYQSSELCILCEKGYPKEDEIVHKTKCNHIFHGTCISLYLLRTPQCPVCSAHLPPVDIRTLLFD
ncbi:hypothetical protein CARUB_v10015233mg [Capsella rubella]|uniref:RING-type domain-containing protein n=1 Tax=Capsella rubella TaxID=81985 RepID=R0I6G6_9BRAS|nr:RING-H2 finger protein ATL5 [Capsella rubella]EOA31993.1 hypothetical protein CARUB_v10015233mg [Capsella rubella]